MECQRRSFELALFSLRRGPHAGPQAKIPSLRRSPSAGARYLAGAAGSAGSVAEDQRPKGGPSWETTPKKQKTNDVTRKEKESGTSP